MIAKYAARKWGIFLLGLALSIAAGALSQDPVFWLLGIWLCVSVLRTLGLGDPKRRALWFNLAVAIVTLGGGLVYLSDRPGTREEQSNPDYKNISRDFLGYAPTANQQTRLKRYRDDDLIYTVTYSINENGLRIGPPYLESEENECILFFGGSFTFGEGVEDNETLPYRTGIETGGRYRIHNFGYHGYGPHQMLAALELGLVNRVVDCEPRYVIYQGAPFHVHRVAGLSSWDRHGPYFELQDGPLVAYRGPFDEVPRSEGWFTRLVSASGLQKRISGLHRAPDGRDYDLFMGILETARLNVETAYPEAEFHIIFWDGPRKGVFPLRLFDWSRPPLLSGLQQRGFRVHRITQILPDSVNNARKYQIRDGHPNARAHAKIARYLARELGEGPAPLRAAGRQYH